MTIESDGNLLIYMSWRAEDKEIARAAGHEFYLRHVRFLYWVCRRVCLEIFDSEEWVEDLVQETFVRAYEQADTFNGDRVQGAREEMERVVRCWLVRIARHLAIDRLRRKKADQREINLAPESWKEVSDPSKPNITEETVQEEFNQLSLVRDAIQCVLDDREQEILRVRMLWYDPTQIHQRLPDEVVKELAEHFDTTPENLRQIWCRAVKKIEAHLMDDLDNLPPNK